MNNKNDFCSALVPVRIPTISTIHADRKEGDSNPRNPKGFNGFRDRPDRPLSHLSLSGYKPYETNTIRTCDPHLRRVVL